ncbi:MAG: trypsin-like peptidase domain-containing protein [Gemmatimonadales bacterium]|nr:trypsin-like peptidase domain-containing protein [Gemmatimonadales bacterium]
MNPERPRPTVSCHAGAAVFVLLLMLGGVARLGLAQDPSSRAPEVFDRFAGPVVNIEVLDVQSDVKASTATGFFVSPRGHLVTNYHVIADHVHKPNRYRVVHVDGDGRNPLRVLSIDVVHDLAILQSDTSAQEYFDLGPVDPPQGTRLYSMGYPLDLGITIVEGTYNGLLEHSLYQKIHFTGSLNPGMSGGPAITRDGRVVGVNVSTYGNQLSFLVPVHRVLALLTPTLAPDFRPASDLLEVVRQQLLEHQAAYVGELMSDSLPTVRLGRYRAPTKPAAFFNCWASTSRGEEKPYATVDHQCSSDDYVFLWSGHSSAIIQFFHRMLTSDELNRYRFHQLYTNEFRRNAFWSGGEKEDVTPFRCNDGTVRREGATVRVVLCLRRYRKLKDLHDAVFKAAALGDGNSGMETTLMLSGVTFENATRVARHYLEGISWAE